MACLPLALQLASVSTLASLAAPTIDVDSVLVVASGSTLSSTESQACWTCDLLVWWCTRQLLLWLPISSTSAN